MDTKKLSVLIPTKNRNLLLGKVLSYYSQVGCSHILYIGDSSDMEEYRKNQSLIKQYSGRLAIEYRRHEGASMWDSYSRMLEEVATPYSLLAGDDDFFVPTSLQKCVDYLEKHGDYNSAWGPIAWVYVDLRPDQTLEIQRVRRVLSKSISDESPCKRLIAYSYPAVHINTYSVQRTSNLRYIWRKCMALEFDSHEHQTLFELSFNAYNLIQGKQVCLPDLYHVWLYHSDKPPHDVFRRTTRMNWAVSVPAMVDLVATELVQKEKVDYAKAHACAQGVLCYYLLPFIARHRDRILKEHGLYPDGISAETSLRDLILRLPYARESWHKLRSMWFRDMSLSALLRPSSPYHRDFMPIFRILLDRPSRIL